MQGTNGAQRSRKKDIFIERNSDNHDKNVRLESPRKPINTEEMTY